MSYEIEYSGGLFRVPKEMETSEDNFLLVITQGCNNVRESTGRRARSTYLVSYGWEYSIIGEICKRAGSTEGGGLVLRNGSTTPENYLKMYRKRIKNANSIQDLISLNQTARIKVKPKLVDWEEKVLDELKEFAKKEKDYYNNSDLTFLEIPINSIENFKKVIRSWIVAEYNPILI